VVVSHDLRCIFVHIPRTGGTSVESALGLLGDVTVEDTNSMFGFITSPGLKRRLGSTAFLQHLTGDQLRSLLPDQFQSYYRFAFVRNPWDRMISTYCHLDAHMVWQAKEAGRQLPGSSFEEFLELSEGFAHAHLASQQSFLFDEKDACLVEFVGRFERLEQDFASICRKLGIRPALPRLNTSARMDYRGYYNDATRRIVEHRYGEDIERFGYRF
jgi:hypothetical protein